MKKNNKELKFIDVKAEVSKEELDMRMMQAVTAILKIAKIEKN